MESCNYYAVVLLLIFLNQSVSLARLDCVTSHLFFLYEEELDHIHCSSEISCLAAAYFPVTLASLILGHELGIQRF